jgi:hypothetical protein
VPLDWDICFFQDSKIKLLTSAVPGLQMIQATNAALSIVPLLVLLTLRTTRLHRCRDMGRAAGRLEASDASADQAVLRSHASGTPCAHHIALQHAGPEPS